VGHIHALNYINGVLYAGQLACNVYAVDASTGQKKVELEDLCANVEGNTYNWVSPEVTYKGPGKYSGDSHAGVVYKRGNILIVGFAGHDLGGGGRSFIDGYDLTQNPPKRVWRTFLQPPAEGDPEWAIKACNDTGGHGWYFSYKAFYTSGKMAINCKDVPRENVINDWGGPQGAKKYINTSPTNIWGQASVDEETGLVYFGTGDQGGFGNITYTRGPNLFAATTMAVDAKTGKIVWWYQMTPRDSIEADESWNTLLANIGGRKVVLKFGTQAIIRALDAATGEPIWMFEPPALRTRVDLDGVCRGRTAGLYDPKGPCADPSTQGGHWEDVMSHYDMQEKPWKNYPATKFSRMPGRPGEADAAFDPSRNIFYVPTSMGLDGYVTIGPLPNTISAIGGVLAGSGSIPSVKNSTIFALDAKTGKPKCSYYIDGIGYRGGIIVTGGVVIVPSADGHMYMIDADNGNLLSKKFFGSGLVVQPSIGKDAKGRPLLFVITGGNGAVNPGGLNQPFPGALMAFGLPDKAPQPQVITKEVIKEVPKQVIKEVPKEVIKTVTVETVSPISYAIVGIGIIIAVVGVVISRRKKT